MAKEATQELKKEGLAALVSERFLLSKSWRQPLQDDWNRYYKLYRSQLDDSGDPWRSNLFIPYCFSTIETILPRLVTNRPTFDFVPREPNDQDKAELVNDLMKYQWDVTNMDLVMVDWVKETLMYGTGILKCPWAMTQEVDGPMPQVVDLFDFFVDPSAVDIPDAKYVIHRTTKTLTYLKEMQKMGIYKNTERLEGAGKIEDMKAERRSNMGLSDPMPDKKTKEVEILEYWTKNRVITVANQQTIIRNDENPYGFIPFIRLVDHKVPHEFYGIGEIEPIEGLQYELNDWRNHRMDGKTLTLNPMWWVPPGVDVDDFIAEPGAVISSSEKPEPIEVRSDKLSDYREEEIIKGDMQTATGVSDYSRGVESASGISNETATGISLIQEAANMRFRMKVMYIEEMAIKQVGLMILKLDQKFISEEKVIRVTGTMGQDWQTITPEDITGEYDIVIETGSSQPMNEELRRRRAMELLTLFGQDPDLSPEGRVELKKSVMEAYGKKNADQLFIPGGALPPGVEAPIEEPPADSRRAAAEDINQ